MRKHVFHPLIRRHIWWLLSLALLLPVAQAAANWHALSHAGHETSRDLDGKPTPQESRCDLCLTAAALYGGVPQGELQFTPNAAARNAPPDAANGGVWLAIPERAYLSRAPPITLR